MSFPRSLSLSPPSKDSSAREESLENNVYSPTTATSSHRVKELQSIQRTNTVKEISSRFGGASRVETQQSFRERSSEWTRKDRELRTLLLNSLQRDPLTLVSTPKRVRPDAKANKKPRRRSVTTPADVPPVVPDPEESAVSAVFGTMSDQSGAITNDPSRIGPVTPTATRSVTESAAGTPSAAEQNNARESILSPEFEPPSPAWHSAAAQKTHILTLWAHNMRDGRRVSVLRPSVRDTERERVTEPITPPADTTQAECEKEPITHTESDPHTPTESHTPVLQRAEILLSLRKNGISASTVSASEWAQWGEAVDNVLNNNSEDMYEESEDSESENENDDGEENDDDGDSSNDPDGVVSGCEELASVEDVSVGDTVSGANGCGVDCCDGKRTMSDDCIVATSDRSDNGVFSGDDDRVASGGDNVTAANDSVESGSSIVVSGECDSSVCDSDEICVSGSSENNIRTGDDENQASQESVLSCDDPVEEKSCETDSDKIHHKVVETKAQIASSNRRDYFQWILYLLAFVVVCVAVWLAMQ